jgi:hypothetical protein
MSASTDEIKIDLDEIDAKAAAKPAKKTTIKDETAAGAAEAEPAAVPTASDTEEGIKKLKKQLADEQAARVAAEQRAREAESGEVRAKTDVQATQLDLVKGAIATVTQSLDVLEGKYAEAASAGDWAAAAKVQREIGTNSARLLQLENGKTQLEKAPKPVIRESSDPVEQFTANMTPRSAAWVRAHPDYVRDARLNRKMIRAHEDAMDEGIKPDTDEYFDAIERRLELRQAPAQQDGDTDVALSDAARPTSQRSPAPAAAPVSRSGNGGGSRPNVVRLSAEQREIAKLNGMTDEEYARQVVALKAEGRLQ